MSSLDIVKSEIGNLFGLDGHLDPAETKGEYAPFATGKELRGFRIYPINKSFNPGSDYKITHRVFYPHFFDDFLGAALDTFKWNALAGSNAASGQTPVIDAAQDGGAVIMTTGAGSTHTMAVNGTQLTGGRNHKISSGAVRYEAAVGFASALTSQVYNMGLTDATTLLMPFTISGTTVTGNCTNALAFVQDAAATGNDASKLIACAINAGGSPQSAVCARTNLNQIAPSTLSIDTAAYHKYRIEVDPAGNAMFYIDDCLVATILLAVATTAVLAPTVAASSEATSAGQTLLVDYVMAESLRVVE